MKRKNTNEPRDIVEVLLKAVKSLPCFSLQKSRDLKTDLVRSPGNETIFSGSTNKSLSQLMDRRLKIKAFYLQVDLLHVTTSQGWVTFSAENQLIEFKINVKCLLLKLDLCASLVHSLHVKPGLRSRFAWFDLHEFVPLSTLKLVYRQQDMKLIKVHKAQFGLEIGRTGANTFSHASSKFSQI